MTKQNTIKKILDMTMTIILLFLMAYQVTGDLLHEWIGTGMLVLFLIHNILNYRFYKGLFQGKYTVTRVILTIVNMAVLAAILITGYSGIVMSNHVFAFLPIGGGMASSRILHLAGSYWSFVLMSVHLGLHWSFVTGMIKRHAVTQKPVWWILRILAAGIAFYGAIRFYQSDIYTYMFMRNPFAFLDYVKASIRVLFENLAMMSTWVFIAYYLQKGILSLKNKNADAPEKKKVQGIACIIAAIVMFLCTIVNVTGAKKDNDFSWNTSQSQESEKKESDSEFMNDTEQTEAQVGSEITASEEFVRIQGGTFAMGSPETENWRSQDEAQHNVSVDDFYISAYELTQKEYEAVMGANPSTFSGDNLPVENISWLDAVTYCNTRSEQEGLTPVYLIDGEQVSWNRGADGYRLPTEAEWEYACRAGTTTPFNTETSISAEESNYYGHYPYDIEENYFAQNNLDTKPGQYREKTVEVDSFSPNAWGLYNMHGNVSEWVWDYYGTYEADAVNNPAGPESGTLKVYRGGGWNDFAKNMRSAYRATLEPEKGSFNLGIRLVRNAYSGAEDIVGGAVSQSGSGTEKSAGKVLIAYFSWGGNTRGIAEEIQAQTGADLFEITLENPYSSSYNTVLDQSQHDQNIQARPEITEHIDNMEEYDTILIGYPNWWASIPMPIASFLEEYDLSGKTIIPFCSHGGGRFGQSLTAIAKLAPDSAMGEGLSVHYSGGSSLSSDVEEWLRTNGVIE